MNKHKHDQFLNERTLIGKGRMADVYLWNGYAYKCFNHQYPDDWIKYELDIQRIINGTKLPCVRYLPSEFPRSIKMNYIEGVTLADRVMKEKYKQGVEDLIDLMGQIHQVSDLSLPDLNPSLKMTIERLIVDSSYKQIAYRCIDELPDDCILCHLDFHFLNVLYSDASYTVIDWVNAKKGHPIYDVARSYVIFHEFAYRLSKKFLTLARKKYKFDESDLTKAIFVMALHRLGETDSAKVHELMTSLADSLANSTT